MKKEAIIIILIQLDFLANAHYQESVNEKETGFYTNPIFAVDKPYRCIQIPQAPELYHINPLSTHFLKKSHA